MPVMFMKSKKKEFVLHFYQCINMTIDFGNKLIKMTLKQIDTNHTNDQSIFQLGARFERRAFRTPLYRSIHLYGNLHL